MSNESTLPINNSESNISATTTTSATPEPPTLPTNSGTAASTVITSSATTKPPTLSTDSDTTDFEQLHTTTPTSMIAVQTTEQEDEITKATTASRNTGVSVALIAGVAGAFLVSIITLVLLLLLVLTWIIKKNKRIAMNKTQYMYNVDHCDSQGSQLTLVGGGQLQRAREKQQDNEALGMKSNDAYISTRPHQILTKENPAYGQVSPQMLTVDINEAYEQIVNEYDYIV